MVRCSAKSFAKTQTLPSAILTHGDDSDFVLTLPPPGCIVSYSSIWPYNCILKVHKVRKFSLTK